MKEANRTVAVTGASGHIGNNLVRALLHSGRKVRAVVRAADSRALAGLDSIEVFVADVRDQAALNRAFCDVDVVYHLAGQLTLSDKPIATLESINVQGTHNVVAACQRQGVRRLVHFSSVQALWLDSRQGRVDENHELADRPDAILYDRSKALAEKAVLAGVRQGLDAVIISPSGVLGPFDFLPSPLGRFLIALCERQLPALVAGHHNFCDVRDVVKGAIDAEVHGRRGERYLLADSTLSLKELALIVEKCSGQRVPRLVTPLWLAQMALPAWAACSKLFGLKTLFTSDSLRTLDGNHQIVIEKAERELGYAPRPIAQTIADTLGWYRDAGYLR